MKKNKIDSLKIPSIIIICVSIFIMGLVLKLKTIEDFDKDIFNSFIFPLIEILCNISITAAIGTYLIEWKGFVNYVVQRLSEILSKPDMVRNLNLDHKKALLSNLISETTGVDSVEFNKYFNKLYDELKIQTEKYGFYLLKQNNIVKCNLYRNNVGNPITDNDGNRYRVLNHTRTITYGKLIKTPINLSEILSVNVVNENILNDTPAVKIDSIKINNRKLKKSEYQLKCMDNIDVESIDTLYKYKYICTLNTQVLIEDGTKVEIQYTTIQPSFDFSYCTRLKQFCKEFILDFRYDNDCFNAYGQIFAIGNQRSQNIKNDSMTFELENWIMPGEGTNIFIGEK